MGVNKGFIASRFPTRSFLPLENDKLGMVVPLVSRVGWCDLLRSTFFVYRFKVCRLCCLALALPFSEVLNMSRTVLLH